MKDIDGSAQGHFGVRVGRHYLGGAALEVTLMSTPESTHLSVFVMTDAQVVRALATALADAADVLERS